MIYQVGTSKETSKFVRRLKDDPDLFPMISVFSEWEGRSRAHPRRPNNMTSKVLQVASQWNISKAVISKDLSLKWVWSFIEYLWLICPLVVYLQILSSFREWCTHLISSNSLGSSHLKRLQIFETGVVYLFRHLLSIIEATINLGGWFICVNVVDFLMLSDIFRYVCKI